MIQDLLKGKLVERHFDDEITKLNTELLKMAVLVKEAIYKSTTALEEQNKDLANSVIDSDGKIDELELVIEEHAINLLALFHPVAADLRFITTGMRINAELERIADLAVNIAQRVLDLCDKPLLKPLVDIPKLSVIAQAMVKGAIESFVTRDEERARQVIVSDTQSDELRNEIQRELINDFMVKDGSCAPRAVPLLLVARHLERICDHATYIAEDVIYMVQAKIVRHHPEMLKNDQFPG